MEIGVRDLRDRTSQVVDAVRAGERVILTVHGEVIAEPVMAAWARLVVDCRRAGIQRTVKLTDALIAATTIDLGLAVVTQDDDYDQIARAHPLLRVHKV